MFKKGVLFKIWERFKIGLEFVKRFEFKVLHVNETLVSMRINNVWEIKLWLKFNYAKGKKRKKFIQQNKLWFTSPS